VLERELFLFCVLVGACCAVICEVGLLLVLRFGGVGRACGACVATPAQASPQREPALNAGCTRLASILSEDHSSKRKAV